MAAQQCRESESLHGIICCYIGFAFFSPCKFQTGNPSRRCALQGSFLAGLAACCHAFLARSPDDPDHGAASPKAVRQRTLFSCRERKYIFPQLQWIASKCGNGKGKIKIFLWWAKLTLISENVYYWANWIILFQIKNVVDLLRYQRYNYGRVWFKGVLFFVLIGKHCTFSEFEKRLIYM